MKAKEMFEDLGYNYDDGDKDDFEQYSVKCRKEYLIGIDHKGVTIITMFNKKHYNDFINVESLQRTSYDGTIFPTTLEMTQKLYEAINQQMKELGWL